MKILLSAVCLLVAGHVTFAQIIDPELTGTTRYDGWANLVDLIYTSENYGGGFPGGPWSQSIVANQSGSNGGGDFMKTSGDGYPASGGIYTPFTYSTYEVSSGTPVANLETITFQIYMSTGEGGFDLNSMPVLNINGGTDALQAGLSAKIYSVYGGTFRNPITNLDEPYYNNTWIFQWDLSSYSGTIDSFDIDFAVGHHTRIYQMRLDQSDTYSPAVPEPQTWALIGVALGMVLIASRKRLTQSRAE